MNESEVNLRSRLLDGAMRLLADDPASLSLRGIAREAGVSAMAPYRHFADKAALLDAARARGFDLLRDALREADQATDDRAALLAQGIAYIHFAVIHPALFRLMFSAAEEPTDIKNSIEDSAYGILTQRVTALIPARANEGAAAAWAIVHGLATLTLDARIPPDEPHARSVLQLFVDGLTESARSPAAGSSK